MRLRWRKVRDARRRTAMHFIILLLTILMRFSFGTEVKGISYEVQEITF